MPILTRLVAGKRHPSRVNVFVDGKFSFSLSAEEVISQHLKPGQNLTEEKLLSLYKLGSSEKILGKILNFLSYRPRSEKEVVDRLKKYQVEVGEISNLLAKLRSLGYLDDLAFAKWFVASRRSSKPRSTRHLSSELYAKGIGRDIIAEVLADKSADKTALIELIAKKRGVEQGKLIAFLLRRGFSYEDVKSALRN